jgi:hypothetical protein
LGHEILLAIRNLAVGPSCSKKRTNTGFNVYLLDWCLTVADERIHGTTHEKPSERFARAEKLISVDARAPAPRERVESRIVPRDGYVAVEANRYPVSLEWAGQKVEVRLLAEELWITRAGAAPLRHVRLQGKHQVARWEGPPRRVPGREVAPLGPPQLDPLFYPELGEVEVRPLERYEAVVEAVSP